MTTYTQAELATHALTESGLLAEEETPSSAQLEKAKTHAEAALDFLASLGVPVWNGNVASLPSEYLIPVSSYIEALLLKGNGQIDQVTCVQLRQAAERDIRRLSMIPASGAVLEGEYF